MIIVIDFDGVIVEKKYPEIGELRKDAKKVINWLYSEGHEIIINTCRTGFFEGEAQKFLEAQEINFHYINCNLPRLIEQYGQDCRKISGDVYIDDKCIAGLPSWLEIHQIIKNKENNSETVDRKHYNNEIMTELRSAVANHPHRRFGELLQILGIVKATRINKGLECETTIKDDLLTESKQIYERIKR